MPTAYGQRVLLLVYLDSMGKRWTTKRLLEHLLFWIVYWLALTLSQGIYDMRFGRMFGGIAIELPVTMAAVYTMVYFIVPRFVMRRHYLKALLLTSVVVVMAILLKRTIVVWVTHPLFFADDYTITFFNWYRIGLYVVNLFEVFGVVMGVKYFRDWNAEHLRATAIAEEQRKTELKFLRAQMHPHFLFNSLNSIYNEILKRSDKAGELLVQFADLLRFSLYESRNGRIAISKEIELIRNYIKIEQSRIGHRLSIRLEVDTRAEDNRAVPPVVMTSLVENAIKHSASSTDPEGFVNIDVHVDGQHVEMEIINTIGEGPESKLEGGEEGIGLSNVRRQLQLIYGGRHHFESGTESRGYKTFLRMPYLNDKSS